MQEEGKRTAKKMRSELVNLVAGVKEPDEAQRRDIPMSVEVAAAAVKRRRDEADEAAAAEEQASRQSTLSTSTAPKLVVRHSTGPTSAVHISNLTPGVTTKCLTDVFTKYGELIGIHLLGDGAAVVRYHMVDAAQWMWNENHGRRVVDSIMSVTFVEVTAPAAVAALMDESGSAGASTISTTEGRAMPQDSMKDMAPEGSGNGCPATSERAEGNLASHQDGPLSGLADGVPAGPPVARGGTTDATRMAIDFACSHCPPSLLQSFDE